MKITPEDKTDVDDINTLFLHSQQAQDAIDTINTKVPSPVLISRIYCVKEGVTVSLLIVYFPEDLVGRIFLLDKQEDRQCHEALFVGAIKTHDKLTNDNDASKKVRCMINNNEYRDILAYN